MNWDFFDIVQEGRNRGYKAKWALYQAQSLDIPICLADVKELGEMYGFKPMWAFYMAREFEIPYKVDEAAQDKQPKQPIYPDNYFMGISNRKELKKAFRDWSKKLHPDMQTGNHEEFVRMLEEYHSMKIRMV